MRPPIARPAKAHGDTAFTAGHFTAAARWAAATALTASANGEAAASGITGSSASATRATVKYRRTSSALRRKRRIQPGTVPSARLPSERRSGGAPCPGPQSAARPRSPRPHPSAEARPPPEAGRAQPGNLCGVNGEDVRTAGTRDHLGSPAAAPAPTARARHHMAGTSVCLPAAGVPPAGHPSPRSAPAPAPPPDLLQSAGISPDEPALMFGSPGQRPRPKAASPRRAALPGQQG